MKLECFQILLVNIFCLPDFKFLNFFTACLFLVAGLRLEATVSTFLTKELTCNGDIDRSKAIQRYYAYFKMNKIYFVFIQLLIVLPIRDMSSSFALFENLLEEN